MTEKLTSIADILQKTLQKREFQIPMARAQLLEAWEKLIGPTLSQEAKPKQFKHNTLIIEVSHPTWMQEMHFFKPQLLEKIHQEHPETKVEDLHFTLKS